MSVKRGTLQARRPAAVMLMGVVASLIAAPAQAGSINFGSGVSLDYIANLTYSLAMRTDDPDAVLTANVNGDDGDRNFDKGALINNRLAVLAETNFHYREYGVFLRGSAFYDDVYFHKNDHDSPDTVNRDGDHQQFTGSARNYLGKRARLLDAYVYGSFAIGSTALDVRVGEQVVSWGESLFFPNMSGAQAPADATKSNVPGTEVKEILLPTGQVYAQWGLTDRFSLMGYYQWEWKGTELNPVGGYFSTSDVLGPGGSFLLVPALEPLAPFGISTHVPRGRDLTPEHKGQWGAGLRYLFGDATELSLYYINYHDKNPAGAAINTEAATLPVVGTLTIPTSYNVQYVDDIKMAAVAVSTQVLGTAIGAEVSYRDGAGLSVNVGTSPVVTRGEVYQGNLNATKLFLPTALWDSLMVLGEITYLHVEDVDALSMEVAPGVTMSFDQLSNTRDATAAQMLVQLGYKQVFPGWDCTLSFVNGYDISGKSAVAGALGSYTGKGDIRYAVGAAFKYLSNLELGLTYNGYAGGASLENRTLADRSYVAFSAKYSF